MEINVSNQFEEFEKVLKPLAMTDQDKSDLKILAKENALFFLNGDDEHVILVKLDTWDSDLLNMKTAKIFAKRPSHSKFIGKEMISTLISALKEYGVKYATWRLSSQDFGTQVFIQKYGFRNVDNIIELSKVPERWDPPSTVRDAQRGDAEVVAEISAKSFSKSRFHNDYLISSELAQEAYRQWGRNSCLGIAADRCFVSTHHDEVQGFITVNELTRRIDIGLIAVVKKFSGQGVGSQLIAAAENWAFEKNESLFTVKTQFVNIQAMRIYLKYGFQVRESYATMRWSPND